MDPEKKPVEVYAERGETKLPETEPEELKALALAYAKYLAEHDIKPGDPTFTDEIPEEVIEEAETALANDSAEFIIEDEDPETESAAAAEPAGTEAMAEAEPEAESGAEESPETGKTEEAEDTGKKAAKKSRNSRKASKAAKMFAAAELSEGQIARLTAELNKAGSKPGLMARAVDGHDRLQTSVDTAFRGIGVDFVKSSHKITSTYRQSRRGIGIALLLIGILAAVILAIFDKYTVYEYAYNGKTLGYVKNQEDVTDVLDIAGKMLSENSSGGSEISFVANQNVTFNLVDGRGKSTDDSDIAVNKLVYMTDIEAEAYGIYDGDGLAAIVKSSEDAEELLLQTREELSIPDQGMELVSADFTNKLDIRPVNVLLTSIQSNNEALEQMTGGGSIEIYHIVEEGETIETLAAEFGVEPVSIFNEDNTEVAETVEQGDKVCIHEEVTPVSVKMVETGRMKETIEYDTIKKESDDYYKGDTYTKQEGVKGIQIFEGTVTKVGGEVTKRDTDNIETIRKKQDKIILVGTAERPKTAPTGTYAMPIQNYRFSSNFGYRWGRLHSGIDLAAPTGTPIYASDGGTIQRAGWYAGYGLCVEVDHENGRMTRYGHCSALLVNVGDKVYQGQNIALVGNTGHSFGSHLHFEINLNGTPVNPRPYLGI